MLFKIPWTKVQLCISHILNYSTASTHRCHAIIVYFNPPHFITNSIQHAPNHHFATSLHCQLFTFSQFIIQDVKYPLHTYILLYIVFK